MAATDTYQLTTLTTMDEKLTFWEPDRLNDPLLDLVVPAEELARARNPLWGWVARRAFAAEAPFFIRGYIIRQVFDRETISNHLQNSQDAIKRLHDAGVTIVAGSDAIYYYTAMYQFHGPAFLREVELIGEAGLTNLEALQAATINAAEMLGRADELGTVEVGKRADLMIVRDDPLEDLANLKTVMWTVQDGVAKTPEEWMTDTAAAP